VPIHYHFVKHTAVEDYVFNLLVAQTPTVFISLVTKSILLVRLLYFTVHNGLDDRGSGVR